jgi:hypothetical protein
MKRRGTEIKEQGTESNRGDLVPQVSPLRHWKGKHYSHLIGPALIFLAAAVAVAPQMLRGNSCGHDFDFHLVSWLDCLNSWRHGIPYPHWAASTNFGAGEPRFIFYPPLTWMLGAALGLVLPWTLVPIALTFLLLAGTGLATRALTREFLPDGAATLAGCAALFSGYALFTAYERSAFGELAGGFWIPLILLFALRDRNPSNSTVKRALDGSAAPLSVAVAGCWLSNVPVGVMGCYLLAAVALTAALLVRSWAPIVRASGGVIVGLGLAAIYLVPALIEQRWIDFQQATSEFGEKIESSWLFARHADPELEFHDMVLHTVSIIATVMIAVALCGLLVTWRRGRFSAQRRRWVPLALIPVVILFLQFPVSLPIWNLLLKLRLLQFPWRWLLVLEAPMAIFFAAAVWPSSKFYRWRVAVVAASITAFLALTAAAGLVFYQPCVEQSSVAYTFSAYQSGAGLVGTSEYAPLGADKYELASGLPAACLVSEADTQLGTVPDGTDPDAPIPAWNSAQNSCDQTLSWQLDQLRHKRIRASLSHDGFLILRLRSYPAWRIAINGRPAAYLPQRRDGLIAMPVQQGLVELTVDWTTTSDVLLGRCLSALAVLALAGLSLFELKLRQSHLS